MIAIKHRFTDATICEFDVATVREAAEKGKANLGGANLRSANLRSANLRSANLGGAYLRSANLYGANLRSANLRSANLYGADLGGAYLGGANLGGADLGGAYLGGAYLGDANLYGANLYGADLGGKFGKLKAKGFFSAGPLGSREDWLQVFNTDKGIFIKTGCFFDSLELFREAVIKSYGEESKHGKLYLGMANVIEFKFSEEA